ncbi:hypothetical protein HanIR_Chr09g0422431 [Helianthus annuus]|nr:hypothetical protein HanIR_Chr09g0422431 [Helianthus annuus]
MLADVSTSPGNDTWTWTVGQPVSRFVMLRIIFLKRLMFYRCPLLSGVIGFLKRLVLLRGGLFWTVFQPLTRS